jgi:2-phosphosulfolactate phosphatase
VVVLIDVLRATSVICTALGEGVSAVKPVKELSEALDHQSACLIAAERNGRQMPEADLGNSPLPFLQRQYEGCQLVLTTSNGTKALNQAKQADSYIVAGSFLNATSVAEHLKKAGRDILLLCAGRHGYYSLEDTMLAGYLLAQTESALNLASDAALSTAALYRAHAVSWPSLLYQGAHARYLQELGKAADIDHALQLDAYPGVPEFVDNQLVINDRS